MSETTEKYVFKPKPVNIISMIEADRDKLVADTRREALEDACKIVCWGCKRNNPLVENETDYRYSHRDEDGIYFICSANPIRKLMEETI